MTYRTTNGGDSWSAASLPEELTNSNSNTLSSVSCSETGGICIAVGYARNSVSGLDVPVSFTATNGINSRHVVSLQIPPNATGFLQDVNYPRG